MNRKLAALALEQLQDEIINHDVLNVTYGIRDFSREGIERALDEALKALHGMKEE